MRTNRLLLSALLGMFLAFVGIVHSSLRETAVEPGEKAPQFTAREFGAKLLIVNFWATSCAGCVAEIPSLSRLQSRLGPEGLAVLGVSVDQDAGAYAGFLAQYPVAFRTMRDPGEEIEHRFGTLQIPESYVIDSGGRVVEKVVGAENWDSEAMIRRLRKWL